MSDMKTAMQTAIATAVKTGKIAPAAVASLSTKPMNERVWRWLKDHPGSTSNPLVALYGGQATGALYDLEMRGMVKFVLERRMVKGFQRMLKVYTAVGSTFELLPRRTKSGPVTTVKIEKPVIGYVTVPAVTEVAKSVTTVEESQPMVEPVRRIAKQTMQERVDSMTLGEAREMYLALKETFGEKL